HQPAYALRHEPDGPALRGADGQRVFSHIYGGRFAVCLVDSAPFAQCARLLAGPGVTGPFLMFERRLLVVRWAFVCAGLILVARLFQLQVLEGSDCRRLAEAALTRQQQYLAPVRGRILDRNGVLLASDEPAVDVCVHYGILSMRPTYIKAITRQLRREAA